MKIIFKLFFTTTFVISIGIALFFFVNTPHYEKIKQPPLEIPKDTHVQKKSIIQIPITLETKDLRQVILDEIKNPISSGITEEISTDIFSAMPSESWHVFKDMTNFADKAFNSGMWVKHQIYLKDLKIYFEGSHVKILTNYAIDISIDYKQSPLPFIKARKSKGILTGYIEAKIELHGEISIDNDARLHIKASEDNTKISFTKIKFPYTLDVLEVLKVTQTENFLRKRILEESINKRIFSQVEKEIAKKQVDIQLAKKIQKLVYKNSIPLSLSEDLWLVPSAEKISISQINGEGQSCTNTLSINVGVLAQPKLISSDSKPLVISEKTIPLSCENLSPQIYLYPSLSLKYNFMSKLVEKKLQEFIQQNYAQEDYSIANIKIYPSNKKLIISIDLVKKESSEKLLTFYLWGTPKLHQNTMQVSLQDIQYTLQSKHSLLKIADWLLSDTVKHFLQEKAYFSYKEELQELSNKLTKIEHKSKQKILSGSIHSIEVEDIFTAEDSIILHGVATGNLSYKVNLYHDELGK
ncbi:DUF4403 family protein [Sulfurimonas sp.]|nr:DUF4403 family protein [Sulfurimonas sp.]